MYALTLTQPWATLVATGAKAVETRSWYVGPNPRGRATQPLGLRIAIHAAMGFPRDAQELVATEPFLSALRVEYPGMDPVGIIGMLPRGEVIATAVVLHCVTVEHLAKSPHLTAQELAFGDYSPGRFAWRLWDVQRLPLPVAARLPAAVDLEPQRAGRARS
jgi:hypothetical protein